MTAAAPCGGLPQPECSALPYYLQLEDVEDRYLP